MCNLNTSKQLRLRALKPYNFAGEPSVFKRCFYFGLRDIPTFSPGQHSQVQIKLFSSFAGLIHHCLLSPNIPRFTFSKMFTARFVHSYHGLKNAQPHQFAHASNQLTSVNQPCSSIFTAQTHFPTNLSFFQPQLSL